MPGQHVMFQCQPKTARFSQKPGGEGVHRAEAEEGVTQLLPTGLNAKKKERGGGGLQPLSLSKLERNALLNATHTVSE